MEFINGIFGIRKIFLSLSFSLTIAGLFLNTFSASSSTPLVSNTMEYDFGVISQESTVYVTFKVTNVTNKPVEI